MALAQTPTITSGVPSQYAANTTLTLNITGTNFVAGSTVTLTLNSTSVTVTPTSITSTQIVVTVPAADIATAGVYSVTVVNPMPGGGTSNIQIMAIGFPSIDIIVGGTDSRTSSEILVPVAAKNIGTGTATNVELSIAKVGSVSVNGNTPLPINLGTIAAGQTSTPVILHFPGSVLPSPGTRILATVDGTCTTVVPSTISFDGSTWVTLPAPPSAPTDLAAIGGDQSVSLSWTAPTGATSYNLFRSVTSGGEGTAVYQTGLTGTSYTDSGLIAGVPYFYTLAAVNAGGVCSQSNEASAIPIPSVPSNAAIAVNTATPIAGATASLTGTASGSGILNYAWSCSPTATFSPATGASTTLTFPEAGTYSVTLTVTDAFGQTATATTSITVNQTLSTVQVSPATASLSLNYSQSFVALPQDQFGSPLYNLTPTWSVDSGGVGTVDQYGNFASGATSGGSTVRATYAAISGAATVIVAATGPTLGSSATASPSVVGVNSSSQLSVLGVDGAGASGLTYTWSSVGTPPAVVTYSVNGTNAASTTTATFTAAGTYNILVTITDVAGLSTYSSTTVTVVPVSAPSLVTAIPGNNLVLLTWPLVSGASGYTVYRVSGSTYTAVGWIPAGQDIFMDTAVTNGTAYAYAIASQSGTTTSGYSTVASAVTPQVQPGTWAFSYLSSSSTATSTPSTSQINTVVNSTGASAFGSAEITGVVSGSSLSAQAEAARSGSWTATWTPTPSGTWPSLIAITTTLSGSYIAEVNNATGTASVTSSDGTVNVNSAFPSTDALMTPIFTNSTVWNATDLTCPFETITRSNENKTAINSSGGTAVGWLHFLSSDTTTTTYYTGTYLQAHFATPSAISIQISVPSIDTTSATSVSSAGSNGDDRAGAQSNSTISGQ